MSGLSVQDIDGLFECQARLDLFLDLLRVVLF